jgi:hypothetical protein
MTAGETQSNDKGRVVSNPAFSVFCQGFSKTALTKVPVEFFRYKIYSGFTVRRISNLDKSGVFSKRIQGQLRKDDRGKAGD